MAIRPIVGSEKIYMIARFQTPKEIVSKILNLTHRLAPIVEWPSLLLVCKDWRQIIKTDMPFKATENYYIQNLGINLDLPGFGEKIIYLSLYIYKGLYFLKNCENKTDRKLTILENFLEKVLKYGNVLSALEIFNNLNKLNLKQENEDSLFGIEFSLSIKMVQTCVKNKKINEAFTVVNHVPEHLKSTLKSTLVQTLVLQGDLKEALAIMNKLPLSAECFVMLFSIIDQLCKQNQPEQAEEIANQFTTERNYKDPMAELTIAKKLFFAYLSLGKSEKALECIKTRGPQLHPLIMHDFLEKLLEACSSQNQQDLVDKIKLELDASEQRVATINDDEVDVVTQTVLQDLKNKDYLGQPLIKI